MAGKITVLPKSVYEMIAAGEVIQSPVSVVKELLENAIDAESTEIIVRLTGQGREQITVIDNGRGISEADLKIAATQHATSKIRTAADIERVSTLGFRGEALFSMTKAAHLEITSVVKGADGGRVIITNGERKYEKVPWHQGTQISVKNLFYNMPARLKQLQKSRGASRAVKALIDKFALCHPEISMYFENEGKRTASYPAANPVERLDQVFGQGVGEHFLEVSSSRRITVSGYISDLQYGTNTRARQFCFINGRVIEMKSFFHALSGAYHDFPIRYAHPAAVLSVTLPRDLVDVNIHPNKKEVRICGESDFYQAVYHAVKDTLAKKYLGRKTEKETPAARASAVQDTFKAAFVSRKTNPETAPPSSRVCESRETMISGGPEAAPDANPMMGSLVDTLFDTYLLVQVNGEYILLDQHAAAERVAYDRLTDQINKGQINIQHILFPVQVKIGPAISADEAVARLEKIGFEATAMDDHEVTVRGVPSLVAGRPAEEIEAMTAEILSLEFPSDQITPRQMDRIIKSISCRYSVMAHDRVTALEARSLINDLFACENPLSCPHGRPTLFRFSQENTERLFGRRK